MLHFFFFTLFLIMTYTTPTAGFSFFFFRLFLYLMGKLSIDVPLLQV